MKRYANFTLMELLVVIGIIVLLAGLILPAVMSAQQKGRITQAKADMSSIMTALKGVENTYNRMIKESSTRGLFRFNDYALIAVGNDSDGKIIKIGEPGNKTSNLAYYAFFAELSDPNNKNLKSLNINLRKIKFLDPKAKYNPTDNYDTDDNKKNSWIDPWGKPYVLYFNTDFSDKIKLPNDKIISGKVAIYSLGPNGRDDYAQNILYDTDMKKLSEAEKKNADDVTSWN